MVPLLAKSEGVEKFFREIVKTSRNARQARGDLYSCRDSGKMERILHFAAGLSMDHTEQTRQLENAPIGALLWKYSVPAITGMLVSATYNIVDRAFIGQTIGEIGITAATLSFPAMMVINAMGMMIGVGSSTLLSIKLGEKKYVDAEKILGQAFFLFFVISIVLGAFGLYFLEPLLYLFGATEKAMPLAKEYLEIIFIGIFFQKIAFGVNTFIRSEGQPKVAMITVIISALLNVFFDWLFLYVFRTGIWGAAFATVLAQAITAGWILWLYFSGRTLVKIRFRYIRLNYGLARQIFVLGMPVFMLQVVNCFLQIIQNQQLKIYGHAYGLEHGLKDGPEIAIAVMGIIFSAVMIFIMPLLGIGQGMQPIIGYNIGAKQYARTRKTLSLGIVCSFFFSLVCVCIVMLKPEWLIYPFVQNDSPNREEMIRLGTRAIRFFAVTLPGVAVVITSTNYFQSRGRPVYALLLTLVRQVFLLIPLLLFLPVWAEARPGFSGLDGIWLATPISDLGSIALATLLLVREYRYFRRVE